MEHNQDSQSVIGLILLCLGFLGEVSRRITSSMLENYDEAFKILTLCTLGAALLTYLFKWGIGTYKFIKEFNKNKEDENYK